jgi:GT2 family glycosyltransferase
MAEPKLSVVIPAWNQIEFTTACVASIRSHTDVAYELIIVDNGSEPEQATAARVLADRFVGNDQNRGFAAAMNQGLELAKGEYVAFVNNDTVFPARWASRLIETLAAQASPGLVLPAVTAAGNQASVRSEPTDRIQVFAPFTAIPSGVVYLASRQTMLNVGGWNEQYGIASAEDLDLLFTFWVNDRSVVLDERVLVHHESAVSASALPNRNALYKANRLAFAARWAEADPATVPRLASCSEQHFAANLEKARIAGTWMHQWFRTKDLADDRAREARAARAALTAAEESATRGRLAQLRQRLRRS